jgi:hypothetical protein
VPSKRVLMAGDLEDQIIGSSFVSGRNTIGSDICVAGVAEEANRNRILGIILLVVMIERIHYLLRPKQGLRKRLNGNRG